MRKRIVFFIYLIMFITINTYLSVSLYKYLSQFFAHSLVTDIFAILIYIGVVFPASAYLAEQLTIFSLDYGLDKGKNFTIFMIVAVITPFAVFALIKIDNERERPLNELISYSPDKVESIAFNQWDEDFARTSDDEEFFGEFGNFLENHQVKRIKDSEWEQIKSSSPTELMVTIYTNRSPIMLSLREKGIIYYNKGNYYEVLNGQMDISSIYEKVN